MLGNNYGLCTNMVREHPYSFSFAAVLRRRLFFQVIMIGR
uniref:Uncharacterized protein n=1 Tax=Rhizophora mucronata TaxID=61149 RepID=A0A2P2MUZ1_RHIMU